MKKQSRVIRKILVPVDFSSYSETTIDYAAMIAERFAATLILMHVIESLPYRLTDTLQLIEHRKGLETLASSLLGNLSDELRERKLVAKTDLVWGNPSRQILAKAQRERADLIIMGTHGRTGLPHIVMGSVAEKTVRLSPVPVLTVPLSLSPGPKKTRVQRGTRE